MDFNLFDNARYEYHNVRKCSDYFAVLIEKYQFLPGEDIATENTLKLVNELQFNYWEADYFTQSESETRFCIIANEFNSDKIIIRKL